MTDNVLYPCLDCGILPSYYPIRYTTEWRHFYECANCDNCWSHPDKKIAKQEWNKENHPDKQKELLNPCKTCDSIEKIYCMADKASGFCFLSRTIYFILCVNTDECRQRNYDNEVFNTPKEARVAWNKENAE